MKVSPFFIGLFLLVSFSLSSAEDQNAVIITDNGMEMFRWDLDFVREAKQSIEVSAVFLGGVIARQLLTAIEMRLEEVPGLQAYILTTPILLEKEDWAMIEHLQTKYPNNFHVEHATTIAVIWPDVSGIDNHAKMFIVDEKYFSTGGTNLDETTCSEGTWTPPKNFNKSPVISHNLPAGMRDQDIVGRGPIAKEMRQNFYKFYSLWEHYNKTGVFEKDPEKFANNCHYFPVTEQPFVEKFETSERKRDLQSCQINAVIGGPHQQQSEITNHYIQLIEEAEEEIIIANLYFCPVEPIFNALLGAVNRGVKLTILTNGLSDIAPEYAKFFCWANRIHYVPMLYGSTFHFWDVLSVSTMPVKNTRIYEYYLKDILLHKKMMIVDHKRSVIGSYNLGFRSDMGDYEFILEIDSKEVAEDLMQVHKKDLQYSREVFPKEARGWYFDPITMSLGEMQKRFHGLL
jgi:phosphatidylserine/phosphatidylglycerophosphate/cardiolipin synthase-like enzyme